MIKFIIQKNKNNKHGFTLVETLVAVSIFTLSLLASMAVLTNGISDTGYAKKKVVATYLAQEGIEYIRNMRDTSMLYDTVSPLHGWNQFNSTISGASGNTLCGSSNGCYFGDISDFSSQSQPIMSIPLTACSSTSSSSVCPNGPILYDSANGKYGYSSGVNSGFARRIKVTQISADETKISSTVSWNQGSGFRSVSFSESVFNWIEP